MLTLQVFGLRLTLQLYHKKDSNNYPILFKRPLALIKEGLYSGYKGVACFYQHDIVFTHSVRAIKGAYEQSSFLKSIVALINSNLFTYYIFLTGTSTGIDFMRANLIEQLSFPTLHDERFSKIVDELTELVSQNYTSFLGRPELVEELEKAVNKLVIEDYGISETESDLMDFVMYISIPQTRASLSESIYMHLNAGSKEFELYVSVFTKFFNERLNQLEKLLVVRIFIDEDLVAIDFQIVDKTIQAKSTVTYESEIGTFAALYNLSLTEITAKIFIQRDIKGFEKNSFYIIKPNEFKCWHRAIARMDLAEISDSILKSGAKQKLSMLHPQCKTMHGL